MGLCSSAPSRSREVLFHLQQCKNKNRFGNRIISLGTSRKNLLSKLYSMGFAVPFYRSYVCVVCLQSPTPVPVLGLMPGCSD